MMSKKPPSRAAQPPEPMPPEAEEALDREISEKVEEIRRLTHRINLRRAVRLAEQAERGVGPLVELFAELGERYAHLVDKSDD